MRLKIITDYSLKKQAPKNALSGLAELGLTQCGNARSIMASPTQDELSNLGNTINTSGPEYAPVISLDGTALFYTSRRLWNDASNAEMTDPATNYFLEDIYMSTLDETAGWLDSKLLSFCKPDQNEASVSVSIDERRVYVYNDESGGGDILLLAICTR
jgi:hypothetical protein